MLAIDTVLQNRYRIVHQLGQGGMGAVYKAIDERLNKTVAIKEVIFDLQAADRENQRNLIQKAFQREANSLVKARHEAVPDITDYFSELDRSYLVMEYVEGDDLAKMLEKRGKPFSFEEILPWMTQLLEVLEYLHNLVPSIIHRDIKPQNLKLNERQKIKLLDFGIARSTDKNSAITQSTFLAATLNYAPFEQVLRVISPVFREFVLLKHGDKAQKFIEQDTDARCDVFGVGATFYHLLTNRTPADVTNRALEIWENGTDILAIPSEINPEIPPGVSEWLLKAMAFERENRFASAGEMKLALQKTAAENKPWLPIAGQTDDRQKEVMDTREQQLMQAKTQRILESDYTDREILPSDMLPLMPDTAIETETTGVKSSETDFPAQGTAANFAEQFFTNENPPVEQSAPEAEIAPPQPESPAVNSRKYIAALIILGILVFAVAGAGLYTIVFLMSDGKTPEVNNRAIENNQNTENINIPQTPENTPNINENAAVTPGNALTNTETNTGKISNTVRQETPRTPTPIVQPSASPTSTIIVEQETPKPTPTVKPSVSKTPTPTPKGADYYVLCYIKSENGTVNKIRKNKCTECPKDVLCELIFTN